MVLLRVRTATCRPSAGSDELVQLLVVRLTVWHLDAERERRFGRDGELGDVEVDDAGRWTANGDLAGECPLDTVVGPPGGELLAFDPQRFDELREARVHGVLGGGSAELIEEVAARLFPIEGVRQTAATPERDRAAADILGRVLAPAAASRELEPG